MLDIAVVVSLIAHAGGGFINTWGFAYVGGVVGFFTSALFYVHRTITLRAANSPAQSYPFRWIVPVGFLAGISIGLGLGQLLESTFESAPTADELVGQLCRTIPGREGAFDPLHADINHFIADNDNPSVMTAHDALDAAIAQDREVSPAVAKMIAALDASSTSQNPTCDSIGLEPAG